MRHSESISEGENNARTLTPYGITLCQKVEPDYRELIYRLSELGEPKFHHSPKIRTGLTLWETFHPSQMVQDDRLDSIISSKKINKGEWFKEMKEDFSIPEIFKQLAEFPSLFGDQPFDKAMDTIYDFSVKSEPNFIFGTSHEPGPSIFMARKELISADKISLKECQSYVIFSDGENILSVVKFTPEATL